MEMRCYSKMLCISYKDHITNEEVRAKIQQAIGPGILMVLETGDMTISLSSKIRLMPSLVTSIFPYVYESWTLTAWK